MKTYEGMLDHGGFPGKVIVTDTFEGVTKRYNLKLRLDISNHSPDGFSWGYGGSGPAQLALALLSDALGRNTANDLIACRMHQDFKWERIGKLDQKTGWKMTQGEIMTWIQERERSLEAERRHTGS